MQRQPVSGETKIAITIQKFIDSFFEPIHQSMILIFDPITIQYLSEYSQYLMYQYYCGYIQQIAQYKYKSNIIKYENNMSQRLSKLVQYLQDGNYEMAITAYNQQPEQLPEQQTLELARAFLANQDYDRCIQKCQQYKSSSNPATYFDANLLIIKATYLKGDKTSTIIRDMLNYVQKSNKFESRHIQTVNEIAQVVQYQINAKVLTMSKQMVQNFGKQFYRELEKQETQNPLTEGIPMFIVSAKWYQKFEKFISRHPQDNAENPGPLTHFQILDHRYNLLFDPMPQKKYTNYAIFPASRVRILPKRCWLMLQDTFKGNQLKRFNVWVMGKPRQIITQIYLKKIKIRKYEQRQIYEVQIIKKQTWGGLIKKLKNIWNQNKIILEQNGQQLLPVNQAIFLEQVDTLGKVYIFGNVQANRATTQAQANGLQKCKNCGKTDDLKYCQCKSVKYCDGRCQKQDREKHRRKCELQCSHLKQKVAVLESFNLPEKAYGGRKGLVGLRNLGNTCYMNSGLQCLSNTKQITDYFMSNQFIKQINHTNPLGTKGNLACAYAELMRQMWTGSDSSISPFNLKKIIGKFAAQFSGYGQQDSQQFISYLIDGLQQDLNLVKNKQTFETSDQIIPDEEASQLSELNYSKRIQSYIRDIMVGQFKSTVICERCNRKSVCFDPYMLLALPIPALKEKDVYFIPMNCAGKTKRLTMTIDNYTKLGHLREEMQRFYDISKRNENFLVFVIYDLKNYRKVEENLSDNSSLVDIYNRASGENIVLIAYEYFEPKPNETRYEVIYEYNGKKSCFQRYVNMPTNPPSSQIMKILDKSVTRYTRQDGPIQNFIQKPEIAQPNKILIRMRTKIDMLMCSSEQKTLRLHTTQKRTNLYDCLTNFTNTEVLQDNNKWYCSKCKQFVRASKQMQIYKSNKILVLAFKRFSRGFKVKDYIDFPTEGLDIGPYIKCNKERLSIMYDLYGVVNHYGSLSGGHYTAYCKNFLNNEWFEFDDSRVSKINYNDVVTESAYVLFYRRRK